MNYLPNSAPIPPSLVPARRRSRGFTLIELILVLSVGSMITLLSFQGMKRATESNQARIVGQQMRTVGQAVDTYIANRYTQITQLTGAAGTAADPGPRTCTGTTCTITVATLVNEGLLPATYKNLNSFGSGYTISMSVTGASPNWNVVGVVTTTSPWTMGGVTRYDLLGQAMAAAGSDSGMSRTSAAQIDGYGGVWTAPMTGGQLGMLGFQVGTGSSLYSVYLRRDGTLPMTGDLNMNDGTTAHNIYNADNVTGNGRFTSTQAYTSYVNLAGNLDMTGTATITGNANVTGNASVSGTVFTNAMTDYGNATINGNTTVGGNATIAGNASVGKTVSATNGVFATGNGVQIGSSYYYGDGANSAIRQNGGLYIQNQAGTAAAPIQSVGSITMDANSEVNNPGTAYYEAAGNLYLKPWNANGETVIGGGGGSGQLLATGNITTQGYLIPQGGASNGNGCSPNGAIGNDGSRALTCTNGVWRPPANYQCNGTGCWETLADGLIVQWGNSSCTAGGYEEVRNFPIAFPSASMMMVASIGAQIGGSTAPVIGVDTINGSYYYVSCPTEGSPAGTQEGYHYLVIGA